MINQFIQKLSVLSENFSIHLPDIASALPFSSYSVPIIGMVAVLASLLTMRFVDRKQPAQDILALAQPLVENMDTHQVAGIVQAVQNIPTAERKGILDLMAQLLMGKNRDRWDVKGVLKAICAISTSERACVLLHAQPLLVNDTDDYNALLLKHISNIPAKHRNGVMRRTWNQLQTEFPDGLVQVTRLWELLKTPLNQPLPPLVRSLLEENYKYLIPGSKREYCRAC